MRLIGEIKAFPHNNIPIGWLECDGRLLPSAGFKELYAAVGNAYGGVEGSTFALPAMNGRSVVGAGQGAGLLNYAIGSVGGTASELIDSTNMPEHNHEVIAKLNGQTVVELYSDLANITIAKSTSSALQIAYTSATTPIEQMDAQSIVSTVSEELPHENRQPYMPVVFCIAYAGEYPVF